MSGTKTPLEHGIAKREEIVQFIAAYYLEHRYPPSVREVGEGVGLTSSATVWHHLRQLERDGRIQRDPKVPRSLLIVVEP